MVKLHHLVLALSSTLTAGTKISQLCCVPPLGATNRQPGRRSWQFKGREQSRRIELILRCRCKEYRSACCKLTAYLAIWLREVCFLNPYILFMCYTLTVWLGSVLTQTLFSAFYIFKQDYYLDFWAKCGLSVMRYFDKTLTVAKVVFTLHPCNSAIMKLRHNSTFSLCQKYTSNISYIIRHLFHT